MATDASKVKVNCDVIFFNPFDVKCVYLLSPPHHRPAMHRKRMEVSLSLAFPLGYLVLK